MDSECFTCTTLYSEKEFNSLNSYNCLLHATTVTNNQGDLVCGSCLNEPKVQGCCKSLHHNRETLEKWRSRPYYITGINSENRGIKHLDITEEKMSIGTTFKYKFLNGTFKFNPSEIYFDHLNEVIDTGGENYYFASSGPALYQVDQCYDKKKSRHLSKFQDFRINFTIDGKLEI